MKIYKYPLEIIDVQEIAMPENAEILCVMVQYDRPCLWARVDPIEKSIPRKIYIYGTGHEIAPLHHSYIGSFKVLDGKFVGHVFHEPTLRDSLRQFAGIF